MATTPENKVKRKIRLWLEKFGAAVCYVTPVPGPFGTTIGDPDFVISFCGLFVAIEAKAQGKTATKLQMSRLAELRASGALTYVVDRPDEQLPAIERGLIQRARLYRSAVSTEQTQCNPTTTTTPPS